MQLRYGLAALAAANLLALGCEGHKHGCCRQPAAVHAAPDPCCGAPVPTAPIAPVVTPGLAPGAPAPGTAYYPFATPSCNLGNLP
jgi:hypothetical protein